MNISAKKIPDALLFVYLECNSSDLGTELDNIMQWSKIITDLPTCMTLEVNSQHTRRSTVCIRRDGKVLEPL